MRRTIDDRAARARERARTRGNLAGALAMTTIVVAGCARHRPPAPAPEPVQVGTASWYGAELQGRRTASGERFDQHAFTAASRTLPIGTRVRVTNLGNGRSAVVRINDSGPFARGRVIDVSRAAAQALGMVGRGSARVRIETLGEGTPRTTTGRARRRPAARGARARRGPHREPPPAATAP